MLSRAHRLLLPLVALLAILPMAFQGCSCGHDFDFHLLSWLEAATRFAHLGYPVWAVTPAFNAGEPRFLFYPPISWTLGGLLGLILPWKLVPAAFACIALTLSGFTLHRFASRYMPPAFALIAATLYMVNPYMLFTAYERSAFAELLAAAFLPLLLAAALADDLRIPDIAIPLALLWLTNAPAAVMSSYALAFLAVVRLVREPGHRRALALRVTAATALGLALAAFYILPAAFERRFVQIEMAVIPGMRVADHFLFHRMGSQTPDALFHDAVVHTASIVALLLLASIALALLIQLVSRGHSATQLQNLRSSLIAPLALLTVVIAFLLTPLSAPIWAHLPQLKFLQFPWRLSALLGAIFALFTGLALSRIRWRPPAVLCLPLAIALIWPAWTNFRQPCDADDAPDARVALFHSSAGTEPTDEYTPTAADNDALHPHDPPYWLTSSTDPNTPAPADALPGPAPDHLQLTVHQPELLILNRRAWPAWQIALNGTVVSHLPQREDGLLAVALPPGSDTIDLRFLWTLDRKLGLAISALALVALLTLLRFHYTRQVR